LTDILGFEGGWSGMTKEELVEKINRLLRTEDDLSFLMKLGVEEVKIMVGRLID